jgi:hypothetical protein
MDGRSSTPGGSSRNIAASSTLPASPGEVTPSDEVDQAWHLHLAYSRDYWEEFCPNVLRRRLHHGPTDGGSGEDERYKANCRRTLEIYEATFGEQPPSDIWPPVSLRFGYYGTNFVRVNSALFEIAPRTDLAKSRLSGFATALGLFLIVLILGLFSATLLHSTPLFAPVEGFWDLASRLGLYAIGLFLWVKLLPMLAMNWFGRAEEKEAVARTLHGYTVGFAIGSLLPDVSYADASMTVTGISGDGGGGDDGGGGGCGGGGCGS